MQKHTRVIVIALLGLMALFVSACAGVAVGHTDIAGGPTLLFPMEEWLALPNLEFTATTEIMLSRSVAVERAVEQALESHMQMFGGCHHGG